jgi:gliding motility-associated protein GldM
VLNYLYSQIDAASYKFNKLDAIVIPTSNYVTLGSDYEATVFISATDSTQSPKITVGGSELPLDESGKGIYKARATSTGPKKWGGIIALKSPSGSIVNYPFDASYVVGERNVIVSPTAMNVMYTGIDNPIDVSVPGVSPDKIKIRVVNGTFTTEKVKNPKGEYFPGTWAVKPAAVGQKEFRVKPLPPPIAVFGGKSTGTISRATAAAQQGVFAILPDFDFDLRYQVTGFTVLFNDKGNDYEEPSNSSNLTQKQKDLIGRLTRGKNLIIKDIKALGPDNKTKDLQPVILKID